jgi:diguanylate cyclase
MRLRFRTKLTVFIGVILVAVQVIDFVSVYTSTRKNALDQGRGQLTFAHNILNRQIDELTAQLAEGARVVTLDFGFREAIAVGDAATQRSVILNLKDRIAADRVILISLEEDIIVDTARATQGEGLFPFPAMLEAAEEDGRAAAIASLDDTLYRFVIVPVLAPRAIAWIGIGLEINDSLATRLQSQAPIPLDLSFTNTLNGTPTLAATTLDMARRSAFTTAFDDLSRSTKPSFVDMGDETYIALAAPVDNGHEKSNVSVFLQYSVQDVLSSTYPLLLSLVALLVGGLGLALVGGFIMARGVSRPLNILVAAADRVGKGDYQTAIDIKGDDEFGALSGTFNGMMQGIREREEQISYQARHDAVTGLLNRAAFVEALADRLETGTGHHDIAVAVVGVERLQEINSTLGYDTGDSLIKALSQRLSGAIDASDVAARLEGDKFGLMFDGRTSTDSNAIIALVDAAFDEQVSINDFLLAADLTLGVTFHSGQSGHSDRAGDAEALIHQAEVAEFKATGGGRDAYVFDPETDEVNPDELFMITEMRRGIAEDQFMVFYQPKIDLGSEKIFAVEALIRWRHPERDMISPALFIPLAERTGDVSLITQWVLSRALRDAADLSTRGQNIKVAINLSTLDLANRDLPRQIGDALDAAGLQPETLILEITESGLMSDPAAARTLLTELSEMGMALSIDDYGTGYSSLAYLKDLPVAELKIDQAFVLNLATNNEDAMIVRSTIDLGHNLGLKVTAEGIEDEISFRQLQEMGCDVGQGYYMARPMPFDELLQFLNESPWAGTHGAGKNGTQTGG